MQVNIPVFMDPTGMFPFKDISIVIIPGNAREGAAWRKAIACDHGHSSTWRSKRERQGWRPILPPISGDLRNVWFFFGNREVEINQFFACSSNYFTLQSEMQIQVRMNVRPFNGGFVHSQRGWGGCVTTHRLSRKDLWDVNEQPLKIWIKF